MTIALVVLAVSLGVVWGRRRRYRRMTRAISAGMAASRPSTSGAVFGRVPSGRRFGR